MLNLAARTRLSSWLTFSVMFGSTVPLLAHAQELNDDALRLLALRGSWEAEFAEYGIWSWNADGTVCLGIGGKDGDCADTGTYEIADHVLCYELTWWGETVGERKNCVTVRSLGDDRFETVFHGGAVASRMFAFRVLE